MNPSQLANQLVSLLGPNFKWPGGGREFVFNRVMVDPDQAGPFHADVVLPACFVHVEAGKDTDEHPADLIEEQRFTISMFAANPTDQAGGAAVVGGNRDDLGSSRNRGLLEIEPLVKKQLFNAIGLTARPRTTGQQPTLYAGKMGGVIAGRALEVVATRLPSLPDFPSPARIAAAVQVAQSGKFSFNDISLPPNSFTGAVLTISWTTSNGTPHTLSATAGTDFAIGGSNTQTATNYFTWLGTQITTGLTTALGGGSPPNVIVNPGPSSGTYSVSLSVTAGHQITVQQPKQSVTISWATPSPRYDLVGFAWFANAGANAPYTNSPSGISTFVAGSATSFSDTPAAGQWTYNVWLAFDTTTDPFTGVNGSPPGTPSPNAWSSAEASQAKSVGSDGVVWKPAYITVGV
jgi:hypothetical protein